MTSFNPKYYISEDTERAAAAHDGVQYAEVDFGPWGIRYEIVHQVAGAEIKLGRVKVVDPISGDKEYEVGSVPAEVKKILNKHSWDYVEC